MLFRSMQMSLLDSLKLAATMVVMGVVSVAVINPAFHFGTFIAGITLGGYLFLMALENVR